MNETEIFYLSPEFWVAVTFGVFLMLISRPVGKYIAKALDGRSEMIAAELAQARALRMEAEALLATYQTKQRESLAEAKAMLVRAGEDAQQLAARAERDIQIALDKRMKLATDKIAQAETRMLQEVRNQVIDIAVNAARTLIQDKLATGGDDAMVREASQDLAKLH